jgi:putative ABC transport system permease protein
MSLLRIAWRSVQHRSLSSILTGVSMALGVALVVTVLVILNTVDNTFRRNAEGFHLIVGAKGGRLDLVLNTVYHLSQPVGNVPYDMYLEFAQKGEGIDAKDLFDRLDRDGDRQISAATEVLPLTRLLCARADRLPDGQLTEKELAAAAARAPYAAAKLDAAALFRELDKDGKGSTSPKTKLPQHVLDAFGEHKIDEEDADEFLTIADKLPDGMVNLAELTNALNSPGYYGRAVETVIPLCLGDSYEAHGQRFRVVGTTPQMFEVEYREGQNYRFAEGANLSADYRKEKHFFQAVVGSVVARQAGLKVGSQVEATHGISGGENAHVHKDAFTVVGVLEPTGTPNDRAIFVNIEGFYLLDNHAKDGKKRIHWHGDHFHAEPLPLEQREVTAILLRMKDEAGFNADLSASKIYNDLLKSDYERVVRGEVSDFSQIAQAVYPTREVFTLFDGLVGNVRIILLVLAWLVVIVAAVAITVGIYNSMNDRLRDIAVMRALGAGRFTVMLIVLLESSLLAVIGGAVGFLLAHSLIGGVLSPLAIEPRTGVSIRFWQFVEYELLLVPGLVLLSALAGFLPALAAYRTDVGKVLSAAP